MKTAPKTLLAPPERLETADLLRQAGYFREQSFSRRLFDAVPTVLAILNRARQIVFANEALLELLGLEDPGVLYGQRPGEALSCGESLRAPAGCGTGELCSTCGAVLAILAGLEGRQENRECRITRCAGGEQQALNLRVWSTPLRYREEDFTVFAVNDIGEEKRRRSLERVFFHDLLNVVTTLRGNADLLDRYPSLDRQELFRVIHGAAEQLIDEVEAQRQQLAAEGGELRPDLAPLSSRLLLEQLAALYRGHEVAGSRRILVADQARDQVFVSDRGLLGRVLGNMLKNALEASPAEATVTLDCRRLADQVEFSVHNPGAIPRSVQLQVFQRAFSTKGEGRGLGTYSMRLLSRCLGGEVDFTSTAETGTIFRARYPLG